MISRRTFITGSLGVVGATSTVGLSSLLAGCSGGSTSTTDSVLGLSDVQLVQRFPQVLVPGNVRLPFSLANQAGLLTTDSGVDLPQTLTAKLINADTQKIVAETLSADRHDTGLTIPYWPFRVDIDKPGIYTLVVDGGPAEGAAIQVLNATEVLIPLVGSQLPGFDTPTFDDHRGVEPVCTRTPEPCEFHNITLNEALALKKPIAYLVGTPAHCSTGTCSPALEALVAVKNSIGDAMTFLHAEIYTDDKATTVAPAVVALKMEYEPAIYITDASGKIVERFDAIFDADEINAAISKLNL
ncbi:MAG: hypothetical protein F2732_05130 [Actinobacteria bacterium]|uniref:Unannotated protein n=1 Tax=freshwater metagenome TaxID=449393 RepID=A0A6J6XRD3_9ZZZZ|nr:hypothetical protein [Actinomycetota bacterium]